LVKVEINLKIQIMKTNTFFNLLFAVVILGTVFTGCKKDNSGPDQITDNATISAAQDDESQDAMVENNEQSVDNMIDGIETNDFSGLKSGTIGDPTIAIDHKDTTQFPKTITLTYNTDTTINGETFKQSGTITIYVELQQNKRPWRNYLKRTITFTGFKVESDSASYEINGSRIMTRKSVVMNPMITSANILTLTNLRLDVLDSIKSNFTLVVKVGANFTDTFTRVVAKAREGITHFAKLVNTKRWIKEPLKDTLQFTGSVTGINFRNLNYSRVITTPIVFTRCDLGTVVISSGVLAVNNGVRQATITYSSDGCKTKAVLETDGKIIELNRKTNRLFHHWW
jgi:hypothetical protein